MKNLPDRYYYPAVFTYEKGQEISVVFPDLDCATSGIDDIDAFKSAKELLGGRLAILEEDGEDIPSPSKIENIKIKKNETKAIIEVYMPSIRMANTTRSINRTVTLPAWLNAVALEHQINFSQLLQEAIKTQLHL